MWFRLLYVIEFKCVHYFDFNFKFVSYIHSNKKDNHIYLL